MNSHRLFACGIIAFALTGAAAAQDTSQTESQPLDSQSNEYMTSPQLIENSYPLANEAARRKTTKLLQQLVVDLLATFNNYKEAHWNLTGPLFLPLHEYYQDWADQKNEYADTFAERILAIGWSVDGRYATIARTTTIPNMPAGYLSDDDTLRLLITRLTVLQTEVYKNISATEQSDPTTSNLLQELAHDLDYNLWQLRIHLTRPGSSGQQLPWTPRLK